MKALLVRIGVDQAYGRWNAPVDAERRFVYVPIPEERDTRFHPGLERRYGEVLPALQRFCRVHDCDLCGDLRFPQELLERPMHLDPDFECLTYGDEGGRRGAGMVNMARGDLLVFYGWSAPGPPLRAQADLRPDGHVRRAGGGARSQCAVAIGGTRTPTSARTSEARPTSWCGPSPYGSGRFDRCIPIGEWRSGAYRVRQEVLDAWGGLSVKDGFIQRSAVPPSFNRPKPVSATGCRCKTSNSSRGTTNMAEPRAFFVRLQEKIKERYAHFRIRNLQFLNMVARNDL